MRRPEVRHAESSRSGGGRARARSRRGHHGGVGVGGFERPTEINDGLARAANSVLQNLLGNDDASIRGFNPQPDPPRLVLHLNLDSEIATVVIFSKAEAGSSCTNVARLSIGNGAISLARVEGSGLELETVEAGSLPPGPVCPTEIDGIGD
jgi:hypothetical protein